MMDYPGMSFFGSHPFGGGMFLHTSPDFANYRTVGGQQGIALPQQEPAFLRTSLDMRGPARWGGKNYTSSPEISPSLKLMARVAQMVF